MNETIQKSIELTRQVLGDALRGGQNVVCSVSGGADSDILVDLCERTESHFVSYIFFDTGIEYQATKQHLNYLEEKYGIKIHKEKAKMPVPLGNKKYGKPFLSKQVSNMIWRLQSHNFQWEDDTFENLYAKYSKCKCALLWWTNNKGDNSHFNIDRNSWLKEFLIRNHPPFQISDKCCVGAKKNVSRNYIKNNDVDIMITGVRKAEGGERATAYKEQFFFNKHQGTNYYLPILYFTNSDRKEYEEEFDIQHSKCYTEYGLQRTGCAGCPFSKDYNAERKIIKDCEPKLYKAIENMWNEVYDYTDKYHEFQRIMNLKYKKNKKCFCGCTEFSGDDVAMNLKYFGRDTKTLLCRKCFMETMNMTDTEWEEAIEGFKAQGCELF